MILDDAPYVSTTICGPRFAALSGTEDRKLEYGEKHRKE